jgi:hypothetical protein
MQKAMLVLLLACGAARAADWVSIGKNAEGIAEEFVDASSISVEDGVRRASVKTLYTPHLQGAGAMAAKWQSYHVTRMAFDCAKSMSRHEGETVYYDDGSTLAIPAASSAVSARWWPVRPGMPQAEMQFICAWKPN